MKFDWKHMAMGAAVAVLPVAVHYFMSVDWSSLGPFWSATVIGVLQMANEYITNLNKAPPA